MIIFTYHLHRIHICVPVPGDSLHNLFVRDKPELERNDFRQHRMATKGDRSGMEKFHIPCLMKNFDLSSPNMGLN
jgi:hypothetical protein